MKGIELKNNDELLNRIDSFYVELINQVYEGLVEKNKRFAVFSIEGHPGGFLLERKDSDEQPIKLWYYDQLLINQEPAKKDKDKTTLVIRAVQRPFREHNSLFLSFSDGQSFYTSTEQLLFEQVFLQKDDEEESSFDKRVSGVKQREFYVSV